MSVHSTILRQAGSLILVHPVDPVAEAVSFLVLVTHTLLDYHVVAFQPDYLTTNTTMIHRVRHQPGKGSVTHAQRKGSTAQVTQILPHLYHLLSVLSLGKLVCHTLIQMTRRVPKNSSRSTNRLFFRISLKVFNLKKSVHKSILRQNR